MSTALRVDSNPATVLGPPGRRRTWRVLLAGFVMSPALMFVQAPPAQAFVAPPLPVVLPPVVTGTAVAGVAAGSGELVAGAGILGFGIGYYGAAGVSRVWHALFGGGGDDRSLRVSGVNGYCWCETDGVTQTTPSPPDSRSSLGAFHARSSLTRVTVDSYLYCRNTTTNVVTDHGTAGMARSWDWGPGSPNGNIVTITANCGTGAVISFVRVIAAGGNPTTAARLLDWTYDPPGAWSVQVTVNCRGSNGATVATTGPAQAVTGTGAGATFDISVPSCDSILPNPVVESVSLGGGRSGETGTLQTVPAWSPAAITSYPACTTGQPVGGCQLQPRLNGVNCLSGTVDCGDWINRPAHACYWGPYVVADSWCIAAYSDFLSQSTTPTTTPSATPAPSSSPVPGTVGTGISTVNNPDGSTTQTQVTTLPNGNTQTTVTVTQPDGSRTITTTIVTPAGAPVGSPTSVTVPGTRPADEGSGQEDGCSFGLKPWLWPYRALRCAFDPPAGYLATKASAMSTAWSATPPGQLTVVVGNVVGAFSGFNKSDSGCAGPGAPWSIFHVGGGPGQPSAGDLHPFSTCTEPMTTVAHWVRLLSVVGIWGGALLAGFSIVAGAFGITTPWDGSELET